MSTRRPRLAAPPLSCDTHMHFYGPYDKYPLAPTSPNQPAPALMADYKALQRRLGIERVVVVQPAGYRFDNRCTMDAVAAIGETACAVVVVEPDAPESELARLHALGAVGLRVFMLPGGVYGWDQVEALAQKVMPFGWHLQLQLDGRLLPEYEPLLRRLPCQLVIDHVGKFLEPVTTDSAAFASLVRLVDDGAYVKLSAAYETSRTGEPAYSDVGALAKVLAWQVPERMLWGSNWPHPSVPADAAPDDADLLDVLLDWCPSESVRRQVLVDNPARLYGFK